MTLYIFYCIIIVLFLKQEILKMLCTNCGKYPAVLIINDEKFNWKIEGDIDWWQFIKKVNDIIQRMTNSADKQLGYFFAKANNENVITYDCFVSKVCFYLWNDIFKTYAVDGMENSLFKYTYIDEDDSTEKTGVLDFTKFFDDEGKVVPAIVQQFIENVMNWQSEGK